MLPDIALKDVFDSEDDNILEDFYIPALEQSVRYDRAVGYFDAKVLTSAARGLGAFVGNGGKMRLIVGATLSVEEYRAIQDGYADRFAVSEEEIRQQFAQTLTMLAQSYDDALFKNQLNSLTWFIKHRRLDIKIAIRESGIYHEKIGVFGDAENNLIVFQGSANETTSALTPFNHESINVFKCWNPALKGHYAPHLEKFERLWANQARLTRVVSVTDVAERVLSEIVPGDQVLAPAQEIDLWQIFAEAKQEARPEKPSKISADAHVDGTEPFVSDAPASCNTIVPCVPNKIGGHEFSLRSHQLAALQAWQEHDYRGVFELATGAGKTITAIYGAVRLYDASKELFLVISAPYQSLADQWIENLALFNIKDPILCYGGEARWKTQLEQAVAEYNQQIRKFVAVVVVDATLSQRTGTFARILENLTPRSQKGFMFVGDECHHHGAQAIAQALPQQARFRIGLSATPDRGADDAIGNENLSNFYGSVISSYTLADALADGVLTPYDYHLIDVRLTVEECDQYIDLSKKISQLYAAVQRAADPSTYLVQLNSKLNQRARLINGAANKPIALENLLKTLTPRPYSLFYCAEGMVLPTKGEESSMDRGDALDEQRQITVISQLLHRLGWRSSQFTGETKKAQRALILSEFTKGSIDALVAMKCLDEGIDIPACSTAFILASSRQPRQFVQRRGRILRKSSGKDKATIYDFFVTLPLSEISDKVVARRLMVSELMRINEFSSLALNKGQTFSQLKDYLVTYDLVHYLT